jgi:hypothetical protein
MTSALAVMIQTVSAGLGVAVAADALTGRVNSMVGRAIRIHDRRGRERINHLPCVEPVTLSFDNGLCGDGKDRARGVFRENAEWLHVLRRRRRRTDMLLCKRYTVATK